MKPGVGGEWSCVAASGMRGEVKSSVVFVENDEDQVTVLELGYGAKKLRPLSAIKGNGQLSEGVNVIEKENNMDQADDQFSLILMDEEAMYLCQNQILEIHSNDTNSLLTIEDLWDLFIRKNAFFPLKYKTYSFFRSQGFFIRSALNYGLDYSLYRYHPSLCHAEMCLFVVNGLTDGSQSSLSWKHISCLTRLLPNVNKILLLCYVIPRSPTSLTSPIDLTSITSLDSLDVRPVSALVRRMSMSATCVDSHHISEIQKRYYQNSLLSTPRQEKKIVPRSTLTGSQRRRLKRKKREEEEVSKDKLERLKTETYRVREEDSTEAVAEVSEMGGKEKKVSRRSVHWNALTETNQKTVEEGQGSGIVKHVEHHRVEGKAEEGDSQLSPTFFGWLSSYFQSK